MHSITNYMIYEILDKGIFYYDQLIANWALLIAKRALIIATIMSFFILM